MSARKTLLRCIGMVAAAGAVAAPSALGAGYCRTPQVADDVPAPGSALAAPFPDLDPLQDVRGTMALRDMGAGSDGAGVRVADLEYDWDTDNVEISDRALPGPGGPSPYQAIAHGTATLSVIGARADRAGVTGLAPAAALLPRSTMTAAGAWDPAGAIRGVTAELRAGDVLLLEQQGAVGSWYVPLYAQGDARGPAVRAAIADAVARGIVVVVPAGNGQAGAGGDLAATGVAAPAGALVVGAGQTANTGGVEGARAGFSNYGADVDVQGPGMGVLASDAYPSIMPGSPFLGTQLVNPHSSYTNCFSGTSSASAVIAGGVASLQGAARRALGRVLTPAEVESRLVRTGVAQPDPANGAIGPRPQFRLAADFTPPAAPTNLAVSSSASGVTLTWTSPADAADGSGRGEDVVAVDGAVVARVPAAVGRVAVAVPATASSWSVTAEDRAGNAATATASFSQPPVPQGDPSTGVATPTPPAPAPPPVPAPQPMPVPTPVAPPPTVTVAGAPSALPPAASRPRVTLMRRAGLVRVTFAVAPSTRLATRDRGARASRRWVTLRAKPARVVTIVATSRAGRRVTYRVRIDRRGGAKVIARRVG